MGTIEYSIDYTSNNIPRWCNAGDNGLVCNITLTMTFWNVMGNKVQPRRHLRQRYQLYRLCHKEIFFVLF